MDGRNPNNRNDPYLALVASGGFLALLTLILGFIWWIFQLVLTGLQ